MRACRMTIRRWMIAVAVVAAIIASVQFALRSRRFQRLAKWHESQANAIATAAILKPPIVDDAIAAEAAEALQQIEEGTPRWRLVDKFGLGQGMIPIPVTVQQAERAEKQRKRAEAFQWAMMDSARYVQSQHLADYHVEMGQKYRRAALRPWLLVARDPPLPVR
jgi:hypothetical protein